MIKSPSDVLEEAGGGGWGGGQQRRHNIDRLPSGVFSIWNHQENNVSVSMLPTGGCGENDTRLRPRLRPRLPTLSEGGDGAAGLLLALQEAVLGLGGDLIDQLAVVGVWVHRQQLLLSDQVGGLQKNHSFIKIRNAVDECFVFPLMFLCCI